MSLPRHLMILVKPPPEHAALIWALEATGPQGKRTIKAQDFFA